LHVKPYRAENSNYNFPDLIDLSTN
jgi:hypothetical protein